MRGFVRGCAALPDGRRPIAGGEALLLDSFLFLRLRLGCLSPCCSQLPYAWGSHCACYWMADGCLAAAEAEALRLPEARGASAHIDRSMYGLDYGLYPE